MLGIEEREKEREGARRQQRFSILDLKVSKVEKVQSITMETNGSSLKWWLLLPTIKNRLGC
jgi:hypothetical protein